MYLFAEYDLRDTSGMGVGNDFRRCCKYCNSCVFRDSRFLSRCGYGYGIYKDLEEIGNDDQILTVCRKWRSV